MRRFAVAMMLAGVVQGAQAADMPDLPILRGSMVDGPRGYVNWNGFYVGAQGAYGSSDHNFKSATSDMTAQQLALTTIENEHNISGWPVIPGKVSHQSSAFGAFAGYNWQWTDIVVGLDGSYMHGNFGASASGSMARSFATSDGYNNNVSVSSAAAINFTDVGTIRGRVGYAFDSFLPYVFGGVALGLADTNRTNTVIASGTSTATPPSPPYSFADTAGDNKHGRLMVGYTMGVGTEVMLYGGLFARAEWEYVRFTGQIDTNINTVRGGLGYKF